MNPNLNEQQFVPAAELRSNYRMSPHELFHNDSSGEAGAPIYHEDYDTNVSMARAAKLAEATRTDGGSGSLVDHIKSKGFPGSVLVDPDWGHIVDGNHRLEAAHAVSPDFPVPVTFQESAKERRARLRGG